MTVTWNGAAVLAKVRAGDVAGIQRGVEIARDEAISMMTNDPKTGRIRSAPYSYRASAAGESPAVDTGELAIHSISTEVSASKLIGSVIFGTKYARALEYGTEGMEARPFARPALANKSDEITKGIADEIRKALNGEAPAMLMAAE